MSKQGTGRRGAKRATQRKADKAFIAEATPEQAIAWKALKEMQKNPHHQGKPVDDSDICYEHRGKPCCKQPLGNKGLTDRTDLISCKKCIEVMPTIKAPLWKRIRKVVRAIVKKIRYYIKG